VVVRTSTHVTFNRAARNLGFRSVLKLARGLDAPATQFLAELPAGSCDCGCDRRRLETEHHICRGEAAVG